ncbi:MAG TPA: hypothetical protein VF728_09745, partial [Nocardioides sp.]
MKVLRALLVTLLTIVAMAAAATGAGYAVRHYGNDDRVVTTEGAQKPAASPSPRTSRPEPTKPATPQP